MANAKVRKAREQVKFRMRGNIGTGGVSPDVIADELNRIYEKAGALTAPDVVEASRPEDAPMHPVFEWNDAKAGEQYRLHQARTIIRSVEVIAQQNASPAPVYVYVPSSAVDGQRGSYKTVIEVAKRADLYAAALTSLVEKLRSAESAVNSLREIAERCDGSDEERMARITVAVTAMQAATAAVKALH